MRAKRTMADITRLLAADETKSTNSGGTSKQYYNFWNAAEGSVTVFRPLPDRDEDNPFNWVEKRTIKLRFGGMVNSDQNTEGDVLVNIPSPETHGDKCPIATAIKPLWSGNDAEKEIARQAWRKPTYIVGGFVQSSPFAEANVPENPIRLLPMNKQVFTGYKQGLMNGDYDELPWEPGPGGRALRIIKGRQGNYASYTAVWSGKSQDLTQAEKDAIAKFGLPDLKVELGPRLTPEQIALIAELWQDWLQGKPFDCARYGSFCRAFAMKASEAAQPTESSQTTDDVLAQIKKGAPKAA